MTGWCNTLRSLRDVFELQRNAFGSLGILCNMFPLSRSVSDLTGGAMASCTECSGKQVFLGPWCLSNSHEYSNVGLQTADNCLPGWLGRCGGDINHNTCKLGAPTSDGGSISLLGVVR